MHDLKLNSIKLTIAGILLLSSGCRNTLPEGQVRFQSGPGNGSSGIQEPPSRLASAFGLGRARAVDQANQNDVRGKQSDALAYAAQTRKSPNSPSASSGASFTISDGTKTAGPAKEIPLTEEEQELVRKAFADLSPELRELAERDIARLKAQALVDKGNEPKTNPVADGQGDKFPLLAQASVAQNSDSNDSVTPAARNEALGGVNQAGGNQASTANSVQTASAVSASVAKPVVPDPETFEMPNLSVPAKPVSTKPEAANVADVAVDKKDVMGVASTGTTGTDQLSIDNVASANESPENASSNASGLNTGTLRDASDQELLRELISRHEQRLADSRLPEDEKLSELVRLRSYQLFVGGLENATAPVEGWLPAEQEFLNYHTLAVWHLIDPASHPVREKRWSTALPDLRQATNYLAAATGSLNVHNLAFCTGVDDFGKIKPFENNRFQAGQQVILYSEVENFVAERLSDGYETHLRGSYRILDSTGRRVAEQVLAEDQQTCNNYRRDYFLPYILQLPDRLANGNYRFELTLEDVKGKKFGQASIPFEVVAGN
jgi:hypothetical protein